MAQDYQEEIIRLVQSTIDRKNIPGIMETTRNCGQQRMPYATLSRSVAGLVKNILVFTFPGSTSGVEEMI